MSRSATKPRNARGRPRKPLVDRRSIVEASLRIVDAEGAEALSTRRIGAELGVSGPAIYGHYGTMDAIVTDLLRHVLRNVPPIDLNADDWREELVRFAVINIEQFFDHLNVNDLWKPGTWRSDYPRSYDSIMILLRRQRIPKAQIEAFLLSWESLQHGFIKQLAFSVRERKAAGQDKKSAFTSAHRKRVIEQYRWTIRSLINGFAPKP